MSHNETSSPTSRGETRSDDFLDSWKEIGAYLGREVRTVQRWEKKEGLPVHRQIHEKLSTVYAYKSEIDKWYKERQPQLEREHENEESIPVSEPRKSRWMISVPILVTALGLLTLGGYFIRNSSWLRQRPAPQKIKLAVLPFQNLTGDPNQEYFSDGMTEEMITQLGRLQPERLGVIARTSAMTYKNAQKSTPQICQELGADYILEGSVRRADNRARITAQLIQCSDQTHLWADSSERDMVNILSLQADVAHAITKSIQLTLTPLERSRLSVPRQVNPEAYQAYLKGRYHANQTTAAELKKGIEYFQQAIDKDPGYALAYAGLADSYSALGGGWLYLSPGDSFPKAKAAARKALALDDTLAEAHAALAYAVFFADWDWPSTEREFKRAIELNPNSALSHDRYAAFLETRLRFNESLAEAQRAEELDPLSPDIVSDVGFVYLFTHRYDESIAQFQKALDLNPNLPVVRSLRAWAYAMKRMYPQALAEYDKIADQDKAVAAENQFVATGLGWLYAVSGRRADALKIAKEFTDLSPHAYVDFYQVAGIYAGLGDKDEAFRLLEKGYAEHSATMPWLGIDELWYGMRSDPRYADLLRRIGLPKPE